MRRHRNLELFSPEKRRLRCNLIQVYKYLIEGIKEDGVRCFSVLHNDRTRDNMHKLKYTLFQLNIRKNILLLSTSLNIETGYPEVGVGVLQFPSGQNKTHLLRK